MNLKDKINEDIKTAMKAKDQAALLAIRAIKSAILLAETAEGASAGGLSPEDEMKLLMKQAKQRRDSADQFRANNRADLAEKEEIELAIIEGYLPKQMTAAELEPEIRKIMTEVGASSVKDMGKVMGIVSKKFAGMADGKTISEIVKKLLNA